MVYRRPSGVDVVIPPDNLSLKAGGETVKLRVVRSFPAASFLDVAAVPQ